MIWLYSAEIAPLKYRCDKYCWEILTSLIDYGRHIGSSLSSTGEWLATFLTTFAGPIGISNIGWKLYLWILVGDMLFVAFV